MLSYLGNDLLKMVRTRSLASVAISGDRYSAWIHRQFWPQLGNLLTKVPSDLG